MIKNIRNMIPFGFAQGKRDSRIPSASLRASEIQELRIKESVKRKPSTVKKFLNSLPFTINGFELRSFATLRMTFGILLLTVVLSLFFPIFRVFADQGTVGAYPTNFDPNNPKTKSWFIYDLKPGETKEDSITVVNLSGETIKVKVYPVDATTTSDGAFALLNEDQKQEGVGSWVTLANNLVTIEPRSEVQIPFTITIPKVTTIGDHAGGIIAQEVTSPQTVQNPGMSLNIVSRVGTRIYETVPGAEVLSLDLANFQYKIIDGHLTFSFTLTNNGNVILTPTGHIDIKDFSGKTFDTISMANLGSVFPGKPITALAKSTKPAPWFGQYSATVSIDYSPLKTIAKTISFFIYIRDWREVIPVPALIFLIALFFIVRKIFFHAHKIKKIVVEQSQLRKQDIEDIKEQVKTHVTRVKEHVKRARKQMEQVATTILPQPVYVPAYEPNIDQMFLARHIKLLAVLVSISIIVLSSLFAFILQFLVLSKVMAAQKVSQTPVVTQAPIPTETPTPTDTPVEKSSMQVIVLNGTDTLGLAKTVADKLEAAGFKVIQVGNSQNQSQTTIAYPQNLHNGETQLEAALNPEFTNIQAAATDSPTFTITLGK